MIQFKDVTIRLKHNKSETLITEDFTLTLQKNKFTCILGPSGCGKTTLLNIIAGLQSQTEGSVLINGVPIINSGLKLTYVFQGHNIFPWKTVRQNIAFGLGYSNLKKDRINFYVEKIAKDVGLFDYLDNYPVSLSGGMKQRVGIARALIDNPDIILMDEPFASLDALSAINARKILKDLCKKRTTTIVFITHNIDEAIVLGDRILVVSKSPMIILTDKKVTRKAKNSNNISTKIKDEIYNILKSNISE